MITFDNVSVSYPHSGNTHHYALKQLSFSIAQKEMLFITGHSGAGKSTLLKLLMLMVRPSQGQVMFSGINLNRVSRAQIPTLRRQIGMVFQDHHLLDDRSVFENVMLPLRICGYPEKDATRRVHAALDKVGLLAQRNVYPWALSGGEQQRVGIARAVVNRPKLLLADEPTGNLDPHLSRYIMKIFEQFNQVGVTVLIASHDLALILPMKYRTLTLQGGQIKNDQTPKAKV